MNRWSNTCSARHVFMVMYPVDSTTRWSVLAFPVLVRQARSTSIQISLRGVLYSWNRASGQVQILRTICWRNGLLLLFLAPHLVSRQSRSVFACQPVYSANRGALPRRMNVRQLSGSCSIKRMRYHCQASQVNLPSHFQHLSVLKQD